MTGDETRRALHAALDRWRDRAHDEDDTGASVVAALRHIEVLALAVCAVELTEISRTLQARHEEAIERGHVRDAGAAAVTHALAGNGDECGALPTSTAQPERRCRLALGHAGPHRWGDVG